MYLALFEHIYSDFLVPDSCCLLWLHSHRRKNRTWSRRGRDLCDRPWHILYTPPDPQPACRCDNSTSVGW